MSTALHAQIITYPLRYCTSFLKEELNFLVTAPNYTDYIQEIPFLFKATLPVNRRVPFTYLVHGGQIVEYALQFILLDAIADHDELLEEQQNVGAYGQYILLSRSRTICKAEANQTK